MLDSPGACSLGLRHSLWFLRCSLKHYPQLINMTCSEQAAEHKTILLESPQLLKTNEKIKWDEI